MGQVRDLPLHVTASNDWVRICVGWFHVLIAMMRIAGGNSLGEKLSTLKPSVVRAQVDDVGRLILPGEAVIRYGLLPGSQIRIDLQTNGLSLRRSVTWLAKIYVEPTGQCNFSETNEEDCFGNSFPVYGGCLWTQDVIQCP